LAQALGNFGVENVSEDRSENRRKLLVFFFKEKVVAEPPCADLFSE
jgi:hypothetical protein